MGIIVSYVMWTLPLQSAEHQPKTQIPLGAVIDESDRLTLALRDQPFESSTPVNRLGKPCSGHCSVDQDRHSCLYYRLS